MAKLSILAGSTSESVNVFIQDSSSTTGAGLTGLAFNTVSLTAYYSFAGANATATLITLATLAAANSAWSSGGFKELDSTNMPGDYRLDLPNAVLAASKGRSVLVHMKGATNMAPLVFEIELTGWNNQDAVHGGLSALPNTAVTTNSSLLTSGTGTDQLSVATGKVNVGSINSVATTSVTAIAANQGTTQPLNFTGTAGSALVKSDMVDVAGAAVSPSTAQIGVNVVNIGGAASVGAAGYAGLDWGQVTNKTTANALTGTTISTSQVVASVTGATGSVTGAVGSVTGAVGSVTGNIGGNVNGNVVGSVATVTGNVNGSVGSVSGAVGSVTGNVGGSVASVTGAVGSVTGSVASVVGAVGSVTGGVGGNVAGSVASVVGDVGGNIDGNLLGNVSGGVNTTSIAGSTLAATLISKTANTIVYGTVGTGSTTTSIVTSALAPSDNAADKYKGMVVKFDVNTTTASLRGQTTTISDTSGAGVLTVTALTTAPVSGDIFTIT